MEDITLNLHRSQKYAPLSNNKLSYRKTGWRWLGLFFACFLTWGRYYAIENLTPIETALEQELNIGSIQYNFIQGVYSIPNIIIPLFGGYVIDYVGYRFGVIFFSAILVGGQGIQALGGYSLSYITILIGKIIFGIGGECISVAQTKIIYRWFSKQEVSFCLSLSVAVCRLGSMMNSYLTPKIYNWSGNLGFPLLIGTYACVFSCLCGIGIAWMDFESDKRDKILSDASLLSAQTDQSASVTVEEVPKRIKLSDLTKFSGMYWIMNISCMLIYCGYFCFTRVANQFLQYRFAYTAVSAGEMIALFYIATALTTPIMGFVVSKVGKRGKFLIISGIMLVGVHFYLAFLPYCDECAYPVIGLMVLGISLAIYGATFWGAVLLVVDAQSVATAIGIILSVQNAGLATVPLFIGWIEENTFDVDFGYFWVSIALGIISCIGLLLGVIIEIWDKLGDKRLDKAQN